MTATLPGALRRPVQLGARAARVLVAELVRNDGPKPGLLVLPDNGPTAATVLAAAIDAMLAEDSLTVVADGLEGQGRALTGQFDLALLDIDLPGIDGIELCSRLRADVRTRALPLLALSANAMPAEVRRARDAGFDAYMTKPIDVALLLTSVERLLSRRRPGDGDHP